MRRRSAQGCLWSSGWLSGFRIVVVASGDAPGGWRRPVWLCGSEAGVLKRRSRWSCASRYGAIPVWVSFNPTLVPSHFDNKNQISRTGREVGRSPTDPALVITVVDPRRGPRKCQKGDTEPATPTGLQHHRASAGTACQHAGMLTTTGPL